MPQLFSEQPIAVLRYGAVAHAVKRRLTACRQFAALTPRRRAATHSAMETIQSEHGQGRVADAPSGHWVYRAAAALAEALCAAGALGPADRLVAAAVAVLVVGGACRDRLCAAGRPAADAAAHRLAPRAVPGRRDRHARRRLHLQRHRRRRHRRARSSAPARGRCRPARSRRRQAWVFLVLQALVGLAVLLQFNRFTILLGIASLVVVADLSVHEAHHQLAAIRARPRLLVGRADGLGGGVRRSRRRRRCCSMPARSCG